MPAATKILFLVPYPLGRAPSQRFRVELYEPYLQEAGIPYTIVPFMDEHTWKILYQNGGTIQKAWGITKGYLKRLKTVLWDIHSYSHVFVHREAAPLGPPLFEWIVAKLWRRKMIYDFDDAIWIPNTSSANKLAGWLKAFGKVKRICKWAYKVCPGNQYLCNYAAQYNNNVVLLPTCVDMERGHNKVKEHGDHKVVVGWTGSHSTLPYLDPLMPVLEELQQELDFSFAVIADKKPELPLKDWTYIQWTAASEIDDLLKMDIGIMPLQNDAWSEGKCGFKLIQYLSAGIPALASPVGVNKTIIEEGTNGHLCDSPEDWKKYLRTLITDTQLRSRLGRAGLEKMLREYSIRSQVDKFLHLFT
jgi:glycosyltransferase involved in cell wall biosynthesis